MNKQDYGHEQDEQEEQQEVWSDSLQERQGGGETHETPAGRDRSRSLENLVETVNRKY